MLGSSLLLPLLLLAPSILAQDSQIPLSDPTSSPPSSQSLKLYHRLNLRTSSSISQGSRAVWKERGTLKVDLSDDTVELEQLSGTWEGLELSQYGGEDKENEARYELSPRKEGETEESSGWVSIRPCHLLSTRGESTISEKIVLHLSRDSAASIGLQYITNGNDVCDRSLVEGAELGVERDGEGVKVKIQRAYEIPTPVLPQAPEAAAPIQIDKEGKVIPPPPPKGFIQKYWMYILPVIVFLAIGGGADEPAKK